MATSDWERRLAHAWAQLDPLPPDEFVARIDALADELPPGDARAPFERACARDSVGHEAQAERFYRAALATGALDEYRRARATIQLASTLRLLGRLDESECLLQDELDRHMAPGDPATLHDEARALLALTWLEQERASEAAGLLLATLAPKLARYNRSMARQAARWAPQHWPIAR